MVILNLYASPSSGKSTTAAYIFSMLKMHTAKKVELVGEYAKEMIYHGSEVQLGNQIYLLGNQYRKLKDLERNGIEFCISDSPLLMQLAYCKHLPYLSELIKKLDSEFDNIDIFIRRVKPYQKYGRTQSEEEATKLTDIIWSARNGEFDYTINGDQAGCDELFKYIKTRINEKLCAVCKKSLSSDKDIIYYVDHASYCSQKCVAVDTEYL